MLRSVVTVCLSLFSGYVRIGLVFSAWAASETPSVFVPLHSVFTALDGKKADNMVETLMLRMFAFHLFLLFAAYNTAFKEFNMVFPSAGRR